MVPLGKGLRRGETGGGRTSRRSPRGVRRASEEPSFPAAAAPPSGRRRPGVAVDRRFGARAGSCGM
jgi:hypothetical protein